MGEVSSDVLGEEKHCVIIHLAQKHNISNSISSNPAISILGPIKQVKKVRTSGCLVRLVDLGVLKHGMVK